MDWRRLFPDNDFRYPMALRPGDALKFFSVESSPAAILGERCRWLENPGEAVHYAAAIPESLPAILEFINTFHAGSHSSMCAEELARAAGMALQPDWVLLRAESDGIFRMVAGAVCFPSGWAMREKLNKSMDEIHAIVPGLNAALAIQVNSFLLKLLPEKAWERDNWGLSADTELNHHPARTLKKLGPDTTLDRTWVRLERQLFYKLPRTRAIVFAIRVSHHPLSALAEEPWAAARLTHLLATMPEDTATYKGIGAARLTLIAQLKAAMLRRA